MRSRAGIALILLTLLVLGVASNQAVSTSAPVPTPPSSSDPLQPVLYDIVARYLRVSGQLVVKCSLTLEAATASAPCRLALPSDLTALLQADTGDRPWDDGEARPDRYWLDIEAWEAGRRETLTFEYQVGIGELAWQQLRAPGGSADVWGTREAAWAGRIATWLPVLDSAFDPAGVVYQFSLTVPKDWDAKLPDYPIVPAMSETEDSRTFVFPPLTPAGRDWRWLANRVGWRGTPWVAAPPIGESSRLVLPIDYDVAASYDPANCRMRVECRVELEARNGADAVAVILPTGFTPLGSTFPAAPTSGASGTWTYVLAGEWLERERRTYTFVYEGTPRDYFAAQDRYWSLGTPQALWLTSIRAWLPVSPWMNYVPGPLPSVAARLSVPEDWTVFSMADSTMLVAGPYVRVGSGEAQGVPYEVWGLPAWSEDARQTVAAMPAILDSLAETLGPLPRERIHLLQVPPEQGGGLCVRLPVWSEVFVLFTPGAWATKRTGVVTPLQVVAHEVTHAVAGFERDEGLSDYVASRYLLRLGADVEKAGREAELDYFLRIVDIYGDRPVIEASMARIGDINEVPEWHAYCYTKPNLAWRMFGWVFGDEALLEVIRRLHQTSPAAFDELSVEGTSGNLDYGDWGEFCRKAVAEVAGMEGEWFYDRWFRQAYPLDYAVSHVECARPFPLLGRTDWTLTFTIDDLHDEKAPTGRETVPVVEVAVTMSEAGLTRTERITLTGDQTPVKLQLAQQPVRIELDPEHWILDYVPANNTAEVPVPPTLAEIARRWAIAFLVLGLVPAGVALFRRHPARLVAPPSVGKAR